MRAGHLLAAVLVAGCVRAAPEELLSEHFTFTEATALPTPRTTGAMSLEKAIAERRSGRDFRPQALPMWLVGQLLRAAPDRVEGVSALGHQREGFR